MQVIVAPVDVASAWTSLTSVAGTDEQFFPAPLPKFVHAGYPSLRCLMCAVLILAAPFRKTIPGMQMYVHVCMYWRYVFNRDCNYYFN